MRFVLCAFCLISAGTFFSTPRSAEEAFAQAQEAVEDGRARAALRLYRVAAEQDHLDAQLAYARALETGQLRAAPSQSALPVRADSAAAGKWYARARVTAATRASEGDEEAAALLVRLALAEQANPQEG
ncbi:MAG: hypothetical protein R3362_00720 [Rhodothermales bacterium]|nr:hypothetical protein [Rhodothermales bacterium]